MTTVADGLYQYGGMPVGYGIPPFVSTNSKVFYVDPVNGSDGAPGDSPKRALASLYRAHYLMTSGNNDVCFLIGNGSSTGSCRLSLANALAAQGPSETAATTGMLTWSKSACHLIGIAAPGMNSRARIATPSTTYTEATFNSLTFMTVSGSGCFFSNISLYQQFSTGADGEICLAVTGSYNRFDNMGIYGLQSAVAAAGTAGRSLTLTGTGGENWFTNCQIGTDTVARTAANSSIEFLGGSVRNRFTNCIFPARLTGSGTGAFYILGVLAECLDRTQTFERCMFDNAIKSAGSAMAVGISFTTAAPGGLILLKDCDSIGVTKWGDTNGLANTYISNVGGAATGGLDLNPS